MISLGLPQVVGSTPAARANTQEFGIIWYASGIGRSGYKDGRVLTGAPDVLADPYRARRSIIRANPAAVGIPVATGAIDTDAVADPATPASAATAAHTAIVAPFTAAATTATATGEKMILLRLPSQKRNRQNALA
jgi:hypothetical protein